MSTHKTLIGGTAYAVKGGRALVDGTGFKIKKGRTLIGGTGYDVRFGTPLGELPVGTSVYTNVNGVRTEFLIVHQGKPGSNYDDSCSGTWLLMKNIYRTYTFGVNSAYVNNFRPTVHTYLSTTFLDLFDADVKQAIKQVKIPYTYAVVSVNGSTFRITGQQLMSGADGLSVKVFLLSAAETAISGNRGMPPNEGAALSYFNGCSAADAEPKRVAYLNGAAANWWLRSPYWGTPDEDGFYDNDSLVFAVKKDGSSTLGYANDLQGVRPALILPPELMTDGDYNILTE